MSTSSAPLHVRTRNHCLHFVDRLHRVHGDQLELALTLAEDPLLVREILERVPPSPDSNRVALALGNGVHTAVIITERNGRFITCLGKGMRWGPHPIVPRDRIEAAVARVARARALLAPIHEAALSIDPTLSSSLRAIDFAAARMPREHFEEIVRWQPLLRAELRAVYQEACDIVRAQVPALSTIGAEQNLREVRALESFWDAFFTASNLHVLVGDEEIDRALAPIFGSSVVQTGARALWAAARAPGSLFDRVAGLALASLPAHLVRDTALTAAALTSSNESALATEAFQTRRSARRTPIDREWSGVRGVLADVLADPELALERFTEDAQQLVADAIGGDPMAIPPEVARALVVSVGSDWLDEPQWQSVIASALPWLVAADAAELFIPRDWCAPVRFSPARALAIVHSMTRMRRIHETAANQRPVSSERSVAA